MDSACLTINLKTGRTYIKRSDPKSPTVRTNVAVTAEAHKTAKEYAARNGTSVRNLVSCLILAYCGQERINPLDPRVVTLPAEDAWEYFFPPTKNQAGDQNE